MQEKWIRICFIVLLQGLCLQAFGAKCKQGQSLECQLAPFQVLNGRFAQTKFFKDLDVQVQTKGNFKIVRLRPDQSTVYWNIESPKESRVCIDSLGVVVDEGSNRQQKKLNFSELSKGTGDQISGLLKLMTMDSKQIESSFKIEQKEKHFVLTPLKSEMAFFEVAQVDLNPQGFIEKVEIQEKTKDRIQIQFSQLKTAQASAKEEVCSR